MAGRELRVLVVDGNSLLSSGVRSLLEHEADLRVLGSDSADEGALVIALETFNPCVVLLDASSPLTSTVRLRALATGSSALRIVVMSAERNIAEMYDRQEVPVAEAASLLTVIRHGECAAQA